jgi:hypothetical protein
MEFECLHGAIATDMWATLNIASEDEHVPEVERCIRTVNERTRCTYQSTGFERYPPKLIIEMVFLSVFWLNAFPHKHWVSQTISPRTIVTGKHIDYKIHCKVEYGQYVQTHKKHSNNTEARTVGALSLRPTDNAQGGYYFCSLASGKRLNRTHWTELPMPTSVKDRVHALARRANADKGLVFHDSNGKDLDVLYPSDATADDADPDYDPADDELSYESDGDSDYDPNDDTDDDDFADPTLVNAGVDDDNDADDDEADDEVETANTNETDDEVENENEDNGTEDNEPAEGVGDTPGVTIPTRVETAPGNTDQGDLEEFVDGLEIALDAELADIKAIDNDAREQSTTNMNAEAPADKEDDIHPLIPAEDPDSDDSDDEADMQPLVPAEDFDSDDSDDEDEVPLPRFRSNRGPNYAHLKGAEGDGSLPTIA